MQQGHWAEPWASGIQKIFSFESHKVVKNEHMFYNVTRGFTIVMQGDTMILSYADKETERLSRGERVRRFLSFERVALRKLRQLELAASINDLRIPPGNRLEILQGDRFGQHSIRINDRFRICFRWTSAGPQDVEIVDYH